MTHFQQGVIHRWRQTFIPTAREAPADAEAVSHILLVRAGYIRKIGAGIYDYLPLAWRTLTKISRIVREEMDGAGASELLLPVLLPLELYADTRRDKDYGDLLFKVVDRKGGVAALGPTHEEPITELAKAGITSYKQLPLSLYQIQTKFRDEFRPRSGLLRGREFIMKDAYSFHSRVEGKGGLNETYDAMHRAYVNTFTRCGLDFSVVEAEAGPIGGSASHEFMVNCEAGEDTILKCPRSGYAANIEKCEIGHRPGSFDGGASEPLIKHHTPKMPGIDLVAAHLKVAPSRMLKTIVFKAVGPKAGNPEQGLEWVLAVVRGDHDVNEGKVRDAAGWKIELADEKSARAAGFAIGYVSPRMAGAPAIGGKVRMVVDPDAAQGGVPWATGADENDHHVTNFNWRRECGAVLADSNIVRIADCRNAMAGDPSPRSEGERLVTGRGIEVGHIFKLGDKYSAAMGFTIMDESQKRQPVIMGCYGIGVSRTMQACVEMAHDENGIIWPAPIAPYHIVITLMKPDQSDHAATAATLAAELARAGFDVLIDDRDERPGVKFKDADLIGIPLRLTIGDKSLAAGGVEFKTRRSKEAATVVALEDVARQAAAALTA